MKREKCIFNLTELSRRTGIPQTTLSDKWYKPNGLLVYEAETLANATKMTLEQFIKVWTEA